MLMFESFVFFLFTKEDYFFISIFSYYIIKYAAY
jgi:hypothetical protein